MQLNKKTGEGNFPLIKGERKMKTYAAYGSNMNLKQMKKRCPKAKVIGVGILNDYKLTFRGNGHANIEASDGFQVPIVLWEITPTCERALDRYEGYPNYYIKKPILVETKSGSKKAMAYVMTSNYEKLKATPTATYYDIICQGYLDNHIPVDT
ncbi:MAG TPA: gamma-glutamylcyclotransferase, partial [Epulopiscium sp.]|nr:gamma-glutamylcyclotransferase [Candidatus Epulonipiscium sp.]